MTLKELSSIVSPTYYLEGLILLVPPTEMGNLEGVTIDNTRIFMLVCNGSLRLEIKGRQSEMRANFFLDAMDTTTVKIDNFSHDLQAWSLFITFEFASESLKNMKPWPKSLLLERLHIPVKSYSRPEIEILERQLNMMRECFENIDHHYRRELITIYFRSFSLEFGNIMLLREENTERPPSYFSKRDIVTINFLKLVSQNFATEHNLQFYADALCISSKHLTRIIKELTSKTPYTIICHAIVHQAMSLLEDDTISIGRIAEELHFSDQAAFCKFFKKQMNISPVAYRRKDKSQI